MSEPIQTIEPGLSITDLTHRLGCSRVKAMHWAMHNQYQPVDGRRLGWKMRRLPKTAEEAPQGKTIIDLAKHFKVCGCTIRIWMERVGYKWVRLAGSGRTPTVPYDEQITFLKENANISLQAAGDKIGVTRQRIEQMYKKHGIPRSHKRTTIQDRLPIEKFKNYVDSGLSSSEIGQKENIHPRTIYILSYAYGIKPWGSEKRRLALQGLAYCYKCRDTKLLTEFYGSRQSCCRSCHRKYYVKKAKINLSPEDLKLTQID